MAEPEGLNLSLDDIIRQQQQQQQRQGGYGKQRRGRQDGQQQQEWRGRGPRGGGGGGGRSRQGDQWGRPQQQPQQHYNLRNQQQQQQQQQQQGEDPDAYRRHQSCWQEDDGSVVFRFRSTDLVRIDAAGAPAWLPCLFTCPPAPVACAGSPLPPALRQAGECAAALRGIRWLRPSPPLPPTRAGNITLDSGGYYNRWTLASLNDALNLIGIRVTCPGCARPPRVCAECGRCLASLAPCCCLPRRA